MKLSLNSKSLKGIHYGATLRPSRDWFLLLAFSILCLVASVGWNLWTFTKVTQGESVGAVTPAQDSGDAATDSVTKLFEQRSAEEARYKAEYHFIDPSAGGR